MKNCKLRKKKKEEVRDCRDCTNCIPIGEGDHICELDYSKMVLDDYTPTDDFNWCRGKHCQPW